MFPKLGSQYEFIKELGSGGSGVVNLALDKNSGFLVAVKSLFDYHLKDQNIFEKFKVEANIYLMLNHPNIVSLKDFIIKNGTPHLVQEYVDSVTLDEYIHKVTGPIPYKRSIEIFKDIVYAIDYAHNKKIPIDGYDGVLHLDIKPGNVLISKSGNIKIIDYGISRGINEKRDNKIMGSPMYMSPEQLDILKDLDKRTDIYALGVLLHNMVTASLPYSKNISQDKLIENINHTSLIRTVDLYPGVDSRFQTVIDIATQKNPNNRYQSCADLICAVEEIEYS